MANLNSKNFSLFAKFSLLFLVLLGLVIPLQQAEAFLGSLAALIAANFFAFALQLAVLISWLVLLVSSGIFSWVISPSFITLPYTSGGIVDIGWPITRDLANMGFVFTLLVIGVATALRFPKDEGYKVKKALPTLIGIILLVNFTPVITGVVMDAANIIMIFFLQEISGFQTLKTLFGNQVGMIISSFSSLQGVLTGQIGLIARSLVMIGFNLLTAMFLILFSVLFIMRYVAIWSLVILSPLAFFAYILPGTRQYFTAWWHQFLQWAFVGVAAAFFLYLAEQLLVTMYTTPFVAAPPPAIGILQPLTDIFNTVLVYAVVLAFLAFGFMATLASGAIGAGAVISTGKSWAKTTGSTIKGFAGKTTKAGVVRAGREIMSSQGMGDFLERAATVQIGKKGLSKVAGAIPTWVIRSMASQGKKARAGISGQIDTMMENKDLKNLVDNDDYEGVSQWASLPTLDFDNDIKKMAAVTMLSEKKGGVGLYRAQKSDPLLVKSALALAAKSSRSHLRRMVSDDPVLARKEMVWKSILDNPMEQKESLDNIKTELLALARKSVSDLTDAEKSMDEDLKKKFTDWRKELDFTRDMEMIITAGEKDAGYQVLASEWSFRKTIQGLDLDATGKLSPEALNDPLVQEMFARMKSVAHFVKIDEKFGSNQGSKFRKGITRVGAETLRIENPQILRAPFASINAHLFDPQAPKGGTSFKDLSEINSFIEGQPGVKTSAGAGILLPPKQSAKRPTPPGGMLGSIIPPGSTPSSPPPPPPKTPSGPTPPSGGGSPTSLNPWTGPARPARQTPPPPIPPPAFRTPPQSAPPSGGSPPVALGAGSATTTGPAPTGSGSTPQRPGYWSPQPVATPLSSPPPPTLSFTIMPGKPNLRVEVAHKLSANDVLPRAKTLLEGVRGEFAGQITNLNEEWVGNECRFSFVAMGSRTTGTLIVKSDKIVVSANLPGVVAIIFKGRIEKTIRERIAKLSS